MIKMNNDSNLIKNSFFWTFCEKIASQAVATIVTVILARLLTPSDYGVLAIVTVFITFCNVFINSGMSSSLVQKKVINKDDFNTAFIISFIMALLMYGILYFSAPCIAIFYNNNELVYMIRIMALCFPVAAFNTIQQAYVQRTMKFKRFFIATSIGSVFSGILGVLAAINNAGVWALVIQYMSNIIINTVTLFYIVKWIPKVTFSIESAKEIFRFGWKVLITEIIFTLSTDIKSLVIGKSFSYADLAYYDQGSKYPAFITNNITSAINKVMLPAYSRSQNNVEQLKEMLRKCNTIGVYLLAPILLGFAATSDNFISIILTDKWLSAKIYMQIFCVYYLTRPWESSCHQVLLAIGKSDIVLKIIIIINMVILSCILLVATLLHDVLFIAFGYLISTIVSVCCFMFFVHKLINYNIYEQITDVMPSLFLSMIMYVVVYYIGKALGISILSFIIQIIIGLLIYILASAGFQVKGFCYLKKTLIKNRS